MTIQQNAMYAGLFDGGESSTHARLQPAAGLRCTWRAGAVTVNGIALNEGDAVKIEKRASVRIDKGSRGRSAAV